MEEVWNPRNYLDEVSYERARLGSSILKLEFNKLFPKLEELWRALFISLGLKEPRLSFCLNLETPPTINQECLIVEYEINSANGYFLIDRNSHELVCRAVSASNVLQGSEAVILSYLLRRFLVTLEKTWVGNEKLKVSYLDTVEKVKGDFSVSIDLNLELNNQSAVIRILVPISLVEILNRAAAELSKSSLNEKTEIAVELFGFFIAPDALLDYLRAGDILRIENNFSESVNLYANGRPWAQGVLKTCQDKFAVEISNLKPPKIENYQGKTRVSVQLEKGISALDLKSKSSGSILLTESRLNSTLSLLVSGEKIAHAKMSIDSENHPNLKSLSSNV